MCNYVFLSLRIWTSPAFALVKSPAMKGTAVQRVRCMCLFRLLSFASVGLISSLLPPAHQNQKGRRRSSSSPCGLRQCVCVSHEAKKKNDLKRLRVITSAISDL